MSGQIPIKFNAELSRPTNPVFPVYKGESFFIRAVLTDHGQPFTETLTAPKLYYQTADMENTWWSLDATQEGNVISVGFPASAIPTRDRLNCFLGSAGENFHAAFTMDFRHSPGATPNEVELPVPVLDFEKIEVLNAPYYTKSEADAAFQLKGDYKTKQTAVVDPSAGGIPANAFISGITQNENGEIAPVKSPLPPFQAPLTFDNTPTEGSSNPVTSDGIKKAIDAATPSDYDAVKQQVQQNTTDIGTNANAIVGINAKIPAQASAGNQLADKSFVNSSIATNTANFLGTYDYVTDLGFQQPSSSADVSNAAIATALGSLTYSQTPTNNDYVFVQIDYTATTPADEFRRFKFNGTAWSYEYTLNNSSFTANQWAAINSGITSGEVAKLGALPTAQELTTALTAKYEKPSGGIPKTDLSEGVQSSLGKADTALQTAPVTSVNSQTGAVVLSASDIGALPNSGNLMLDGSINASNFLAAAQLIVGTSSNGLILSQDNNYVYATVKAADITIATYKFPKDSDLAGDNGNIARLLDIYAAVQQIAPAWVSGTTYAADAKVSYNGVVYARKTSGTITSSTNPASDTTNWEAKKVSELFVPWVAGDIWLDSSKCVSVGGEDAGSTKYKYGEIDHDSGNIVKIPSKSGTLALLQNLAPDFSTSATYAVGQLCVYNTKLYRCTTAITTAEAWTAAHWTEATVEDVLAVIRSALALKAPLASPAFTGTPTAPNMDAQSTDGQIANKKYVDDKVAGVPLRYDMPTAVALVADNDEATLVCADRAVTNATIATGFSTLNLTFPTAVTGKVRDFYLRITVAAGESAPALSIPQGITIENPDGAVPEIADGETSAASTTLVWFSETAPNIFTAKSETVKAVA